MGAGIDDWAYIKSECDGEADCSVINQGSVFIGNCTVQSPGSNDTAYMTVYYNCVGGT